MTKKQLIIGGLALGVVLYFTKDKWMGMFRKANPSVPSADTIKVDPSKKDNSVASGDKSVKS